MAPLLMAHLSVPSHRQPKREGGGVARRKHEQNPDYPARQGEDFDPQAAQRQAPTGCLRAAPPHVLPYQGKRA